MNSPSSTAPHLAYDTRVDALAAAMRAELETGKEVSHSETHVAEFERVMARFGVQLAEAAGEQAQLQAALREAYEALSTYHLDHEEPEWLWGFVHSQHAPALHSLMRDAALAAGLKPEPRPIDVHDVTWEHRPQGFQWLRVALAEQQRDQGEQGETPEADFAVLHLSSHCLSLSLDANPFGDACLIPVFDLQLAQPGDQVWSALVFDVVAQGLLQRVVLRAHHAPVAAVLKRLAQAWAEPVFAQEASPEYGDVAFELAGDALTKLDWVNRDAQGQRADLDAAPQERLDLLPWPADEDIAAGTNAKASELPLRVMDTATAHDTQAKMPPYGRDTLIWRQVLGWQVNGPGLADDAVHITLDAPGVRKDFTGRSWPFTVQVVSDVLACTRLPDASA